MRNPRTGIKRFVNRKSVWLNLEKWAYKPLLTDNMALHKQLLKDLGALLFIDLGIVPNNFFLIIFFFQLIYFRKNFFEEPKLQKAVLYTLYIFLVRSFRYRLLIVSYMLGYGVLGTGKREVIGKSPCHLVS